MSMISINRSQLARDGINVSYTDDSTQNLSFANKTLTVDSGLVVNTKKTTLNAGLEVNVEKATLNAGLEVTGNSTLKNALEVLGNSTLKSGLEVSGNLTKLKNGLEVTGKTTLNDELEVNKKVTLTKDFEIVGDGNNVTKISNSDVQIQDCMLQLNNTTVMARAGLNVSGVELNVRSGVKVIDSNIVVENGGLIVANPSTFGDGLTVNHGLTVNDYLTYINAGVEVSGRAEMKNGLTVNGPAGLSASKLNSGLVVGNGTTLNGGATVNGDATFNNDVKIPNSTLTVKELVVTGNKTVLNTTDLEIKDNTFLMASGNVSDITESGFMLQYKPATSSVPLYSGLKRAPVSGEFIFFKDSTSKIGQDHFGSEASQDAVNDALVITAAATSSLNSANAALAGADAAINAAVSAQEEARLAAPKYNGSDYLPTIKGEHLTINYGTPKTMDGFNLGGNSGWNRFKTYHFLASDDGVSYRYLSKVSLNQNTDSNVRATWTSNTFVYLRVVFQDLYAYGVHHGSTGRGFCPFFNSVDFNPVTMDQITWSAGIEGYEQGGTYMYYLQPYFFANTYDRFPAVGNTSIYLGNESSPVASAVSAPGYIDYVLLGFSEPTSQAYLDFVSANQTLITAYFTAKNLVQTRRDSKVSSQTAVSQAQRALDDANTALTNARTKASDFSPDQYAMVIATSFNSASDARLKKDIVPLDNVLEKLDSIRGVRYNWMSEANSQDSQVGVIAQEIQAVYPELVNLGGNGFLSVDYPKLTAVLIQAVKELKALVLSK